MKRIIEPAIAHYHELLQNGHWQSTYELVTQGGRERQLRSYGKPIAQVMRPLFLEPAAYAALQQAALLVQRAVTQLADRVIADAALRARMRLTPQEEARVTGEQRPMEPFARLDGFIGDDGVVRFLEYNSNPAGPHLSHQMGQLFDALPVMAEFRRRYRARYLESEQRMIPACIRAHHERGGSGVPSVGVVVAGGMPDDVNQVWSESLFMLQSALAAGMPVRLIEADSLEYRDGRLRSGDFVIDYLTYLEYTDFLRIFPPAHAVWRALRAGDVCLLGSFALMIARGNKALFALLTDPELAAMFAPEVQAALRRHVPWTRVLVEGRTDFHGQAVDLLPFLVENRERFALKPTNTEGGRGVVLGWLSDGATWEAALRRGLESAHVVQERVQPGRAIYPWVRDGQLELAERNEDCNPFLWNQSEAEGCFVRLSGTGMLNLQADGTLAPLFLVEPA